MKNGAAKTQVIHVRVETDLIRKLDKVAKDTDRPRAYVLQKLVAEALEARSQVAP